MDGVRRYLKCFTCVYEARRLSVDNEFCFAFHNVGRFNARMSMTPDNGSRRNFKFDDDGDITRHRSVHLLKNLKRNSGQRFGVHIQAP